MAFTDELRDFDKSAEQIKLEKRGELREIIAKLLNDNFENWASYIFGIVKADIKKKAEQGLFQIVGKDKKEISGATELRSEINGFYKTRTGMRCNVHPCFKISLDEETRAKLEQNFDERAKGKDASKCMNFTGVGVMLVDDSLWCQRIYFDKPEKMFFLFTVSGKPKSEFVEALVQKVEELGESEEIKIKVLPESGCIRVNYSIKY